MRFELGYLAAVLTFLLICDMTASMWMPCTPCKDDEECIQPPPQFCPYGEAQDFCKRRVCAKGPRERCGGRLKMYGECGEGLMCKTDERCHGCYIQTLECTH